MFDDALHRALSEGAARGDTVFLVATEQHHSERLTAMLSSLGALVIVEQTGGTPPLERLAHLRAFAAQTEGEVWWVLRNLRAPFVPPPLGEGLRVVMEVDQLDHHLRGWSGLPTQLAAYLDTETRTELNQHHTTWTKLSDDARTIHKGLCSATITPTRDEALPILADSLDLSEDDVARGIRELVDLELLEERNARYVCTRRLAPLPSSGPPLSARVLGSLVRHGWSLLRGYWRGDHAQWYGFAVRHERVLMDIAQNPSLDAQTRCRAITLVAGASLFPSRGILPDDVQFTTLRDEAFPGLTADEQETFGFLFDLFMAMRAVRVDGAVSADYTPVTERDVRALLDPPCVLFQHFFCFWLGVYRQDTALMSRVLQYEQQHAEAPWPVLGLMAGMARAILANAQRDLTTARAEYQVVLRESQRLGDMVWEAAARGSLLRLNHATGSLGESMEHARGLRDTLREHPYLNDLLAPFLLMAIPLFELEIGMYESAITSALQLARHPVHTGDQQSGVLLRALIHATCALAAQRLGHDEFARQAYTKLQRVFAPRGEREEYYRAIYSIVARGFGDEVEGEVTALSAPWAFVLERILATPTLDTAGVLYYHPEGDWFVLPDHTFISLGRRSNLKRALSKLAGAGGEDVSSEDLIAHVWPGERFDYEQGMSRLRVLIYHLRNAGLRDILKTTQGGYHLDRDLRMEARTTPPEDHDAER